MISISKHTKFRLLKDKLAYRGMVVLTACSLLTAIIIGVSLYLKSYPILHQYSLGELLHGKTWRPFKGQFGFMPFIMGTLWVTGIAIILALPLALLMSIFLTEYAHPLLKRAIFPLVDILAGIPPVVYGVWGVLVIVPFVSDTLAPHFIEYSSGYTVLSGGILLAIMIIPLLISLFVEIFIAIPKELRDASLSLGATDWQTAKFVVVRKSLPGIMAAVVLAISRAFGETIAVLMVCGNVTQLPKSLFDPGYPLPALIANNYGEMMSVPLYESALMLAAFILFIIIFVFNFLSRWALTRIERRFAL